MVKTADLNRLSRSNINLSRDSNSYHKQSNQKESIVEKQRLETANRFIFPFKEYVISLPTTPTLLKFDT